jgi:hypothetical protein
MLSGGSLLHGGMSLTAVSAPGQWFRINAVNSFAGCPLCLP